MKEILIIPDVHGRSFWREAVATGDYQIVGHTMQFYGPIINNKFACLDCQTAFTLNEHGGIKPLT